MPKNVVLMEIEKVTWELEDTKTLRLKWPENYDPVYKTGQFITLYWPDCPKYKRAYSLSSSALDRGFYEVTIKRDGKMGTRMVDWAEEGQKLHVIPPVGRFLCFSNPISTWSASLEAPESLLSEGSQEKRRRAN